MLCNIFSKIFLQDKITENIKIWVSKTIKTSIFLMHPFKSGGEITSKKWSKERGTGRTAERLHQRMEEAEGKGGGGTKETKGATSEAEGDKSRTGEKVSSAEERRGGQIEKRTSWEEGPGGRREEEKTRGSRKEKTNDDAG